jgi:RNA polymerase sigma-70 factor (ECF subfamily)
MFERLFRGHKDLRDLADGEIVRRVRAGDEAAFEELLRRHRGLVVTTAYGVLGDPDDAQDVAQEVFASAAQRMDQLQEPDRVRNWLVRIARNAAIETLRRRRGPQVVSLEELRSESSEGVSLIERIPDSAPCPRTQAETSQTFAILNEVMDALPQNYREPLVLRVRNGMSYQEVADALGLTLAATKVRIFRARDMLIVKLRERDIRLNYRESAGRDTVADA